MWCSKAARRRRCGCFFFFNDTATTEIYTLSLHDALPIYPISIDIDGRQPNLGVVLADTSRVSGAFNILEIVQRANEDRKSTRLNSSHGYISYAVFCLKKKKNYVIPANFAFVSVQDTSALA